MEGHSVNTLLTQITSLSLVDVMDRGVPNKERIALYANEAVHLGQFGLMIGLGKEDGSAVPIPDNLLYFGPGFMRKGDWLFVYSGPGIPRADPIGSDTALLSVYWGKKQTAFYVPELVPILFRVGEVSVLPLPPKPIPLPQYGQTEPFQTALRLDGA